MTISLIEIIMRYATIRKSCEYLRFGARVVVIINLLIIYAKTVVKQTAKKTWLIKGQEVTDRQIVSAILMRDSYVTKEFLYRQCYPLFSAIYNKYYTDCNDVLEFINEIYIYILVPHKRTKHCKLQDFGYRCSLTMWLKIVSENFCHQLFTKRRELSEDNITSSDRFAFECDSLQTEVKALDMQDLHKILSMMPCERYSRLIQLRYVDERTNEEVAALLTMTMAVYYNVHKRAKAQFCEVLRKEGLI